MNGNALADGDELRTGLAELRATLDDLERGGVSIVSAGSGGISVDHLDALAHEFARLLSGLRREAGMVGIGCTSRSEEQQLHTGHHRRHLAVIRHLTK
jgi:hypothetical protein